MKDFFKERRPHDGLTYEAYLSTWEAEAKVAPESGLTKEERKLLHYVRLNYDRTLQVHEEYEPSEALREAMAAIDEPQLWMVLTETWCGDSAYCLPVIAEAARLSENVELRLLPRDENLDIMDQYLTGASRSIPKLVAFSGEGEERFTWGARPEEAQRLFEERRAEGKPKREIIPELLEWYARGGWQQVDEELAETITETVPAS